MSKPKRFYEFLKFSTMGLEMGAAVVIGLLAGIFLDRKFGTYPWLTLLFLCFGFAAAVKALMRAVRSDLFDDELQDEENGEENHENR
jgi:ATP synthase protein I